MPVDDFAKSELRVLAAPSRLHLCEQLREPRSAQVPGAFDQSSVDDGLVEHRKAALFQTHCVHGDIERATHDHLQARKRVPCCPRWPQLQEMARRWRKGPVPAIIFTASSGTACAHCFRSAHEQVQAGQDEPPLQQHRPRGFSHSGCLFLFFLTTLYRHTMGGTTRRSRSVKKQHPNVGKGSVLACRTQPNPGVGSSAEGGARGQRRAFSGASGRPRPQRRVWGRRFCGTVDV